MRAVNEPGVPRNAYTANWFACFADPLSRERTAAEVAAVMERLALPEFRRVLDLCCGSGRHTAGLAAAGYLVTGVDRDATALARAAASAPGAIFHQLDQRNIGDFVGSFDGVMLLWQSFGYFSPTENDQVLDGISRLLRPGGRLLMDVFNPEYFQKRQGQRAHVPPGVAAIEDWLDGRLCSRIVYEDGTSELMDFEVFTPDELVLRAERASLRLVEACSWWDRQRPPNPNDARYQLTLERLPQST